MDFPFLLGNDKKLSCFFFMKKMTEFKPPQAKYEASILISSALKNTQRCKKYIKCYMNFMTCIHVSLNNVNKLLLNELTFTKF